MTDMETEPRKISRTQALKPLGITCTSSDCENELHCFRATTKMRRSGIKGVCRECGASLVDWTRIEKLDLEDVDYTFKSLQFEMIRHHFWHVEIDQRARNYAVRKGRRDLAEAAINRIMNSVASPDHPRQGRQTPFEGNILFYAQHAVAACCRVCIEEWYSIPRDRQLTDAQVDFLSSLVMRYIDLRLPDLEENGSKVPPIRRPRAKT